MSSTLFQWLRCNVVFLDDDRVKTTSYMNNLHLERYLKLHMALVISSASVSIEYLCEVCNAYGPGSR